jgi:hypothetical protein
MFILLVMKHKSFNLLNYLLIVKSFGGGDRDSPESS